MTNATTGTGALRMVPHQPKRASVTLAAGTIVLTLRGALPVEQLHRGDRVITRSGGTELKRAHTPDHKCFRLEFDNPEVVYILGDQYGAPNAPEWGDTDSPGALGRVPSPGPGEPSVRTH